MFKFFKAKVNKIYNQFTKKVSSIFTNNNLDEKFLNELKILLLSSDTGVKTTNKIIDHLKNKISSKNINNMEEAKSELEKILLNILEINSKNNELNKIIMLVGINGTGKTTFAAKLANQLKNNNQKVLLIAADTFRAAAVEQLKSWGEKINIEVFAPSKSSDPASAVYDGLSKFKNENFDYVIIDTAGRLQTKVNLMKELEKINKVIKKITPEQKVTSFLTVDAMLGQNSFEQAKIFKEITDINGIVLTKIDGTGKGGIIFSITQELNLPVKYITFGENIDDIKKFIDKEFINDLLSE
jgi:fused signal recognition particle receptor